jgi:hypothetical protein
MLISRNVIVFYPPRAPVELRERLTTVVAELDD